MTQAIASVAPTLADRLLDRVGSGRHHRDPRHQAAATAHRRTRDRAGRARADRAPGGLGRQRVTGRRLALEDQQQDADHQEGPTDHEVDDARAAAAS